MECPTCKVAMMAVWDEPMGLVARCPACLRETVVSYDRRKVQRDGMDTGKAA